MLCRIRWTPKNDAHTGVSKAKQAIMFGQWGALIYVQNVHKTTSGLWGAFSQPTAKPATPVAQPAGLLPAPGPIPASAPGRRTLGRLGFGRARVGGAFKFVAGAVAGTAYDPLKIIVQT